MSQLRHGGVELLGVLVGLMVLIPDVVTKGSDHTGTLTLSCGTDNFGNTFLLDRLLTTKYPLGVILMEVAYQCRRRRATLRANWVPRLENQEADDLTNMEFKCFDPARRIDVDLDKLEFGVLRDLFEVGDAYIAELDALKAVAKSRVVEEGARRKRKLAGESLRDHDPYPGLW